MGLAALTVKANQSFLYILLSGRFSFTFWDSYSTYNQGLRPNNFHSLLNQFPHCIVFALISDFTVNEA